MDSDAESLVDLLVLWRYDMVQAVRDLFGEEPDEWQAKVLRAFVENDNILMQACKGPGKSCVMAWIGWIFLLTRMNSNVICTSITGDNLKDGLWKELAYWQKKSPLLMKMFRWQKTRIENVEHPETWFATARSYSKSADSGEQAHSLAGMHMDYMLSLVDESGGIPMSVMAAIEATQATNKETKIVQAGNPTNLDGFALYECSQSPKWIRFEITGDPDSPDRSPRISKEWAAEQIARWGRDNAWVRVNVLGKFPLSALNQLIERHEVEAAMARVPPEHDHVSQKRVGCDAARSIGGDMTCIAMRQGLRVWPFIEMRGLRGPEIASRIAGIRHEWGTDVEYVDDTGGYGATVIDSLMTIGLAPVGVPFSGRADDTHRYLNKRSEMWFRMAEWIRRGGCLPKDDQLFRELTSVQYTHSGDKLVLESKDQLKTRLGFSPDKADALALTFAHSDIVRRSIVTPSEHRAEVARLQAMRDWDPLEESRW